MPIRKPKAMLDAEERRWAVQMSEDDGVSMVPRTRARIEELETRLAEAEKARHVQQLTHAAECADLRHKLAEAEQQRDETRQAARQWQRVAQEAGYGRTRLVEAENRVMMAEGTADQAKVFAAKNEQWALGEVKLRMRYEKALRDIIEEDEFTIFGHRLSTPRSRIARAALADTPPKGLQPMADTWSQVRDGGNKTFPADTEFDIHDGPIILGAEASKRLDDIMASPSGELPDPPVSLDGTVKGTVQKPRPVHKHRLEEAE